MIVCHYNDPHLSHAVNSLKNQSKKTDIVLVDDGSAQQFKHFYKNVKIINLIQNRGIGHARSVGINYTLNRRFNFIGFLDSDGIAHPRFIEKAIQYLENNKNILGVSARKDVANPKSRIALVKYHYKIYKEDNFQLDCSLFRTEAIKGRTMPDRIVGEDSVFIGSFSEGALRKLNLPYYHFEREDIRSFFRDEFYGAYYSFKSNPMRITKQFLATPFSSLKMILVKRWVLEGVLFPLRQLIWLCGYLMGQNY